MVCCIAWLGLFRFVQHCDCFFRQVSPTNKLAVMKNSYRDVSGGTFAGLAFGRVGK